MDIDNPATNPNDPGRPDVEQALLQQFSCLGTTDRDELVKELQNIVGNNVSYGAAAFFLDMNNWNLQAAICSYFDVENPNKLPMMCVLSDPRATEYENIEPNLPFSKTWLLHNNGSDPWPVGCTLRCAGGEALGANTVILPCIYPGEGRAVTLHMTSPSTPGIYQSKWRMCTPGGSYFGDCLWVILTVVEQGTMDLTQRLSHLNTVGNEIPPVNSNVHNPFNLNIRNRSASGPQDDHESKDAENSMS